MESIFLDACKSGDIQTLRSLDYSRIDIHADDDWAFRYACYYGHLNVVKFLPTLEPSHGSIDIHAGNEYAFQIACKNGHLDVVKFLLTLEPDHGRIDIHADDELAFRFACHYGRLDVVKFLLTLEPDHGRIDIHADNEYAFRIACNNGYFDIVKFLLTLESDHNRINIHAWNENAFRFSKSRIRSILIRHDPKCNWKAVKGYKSYQRKKSRMVSRLTLLHKKMIQIDTDILELNVIGIVKEYLVKN
jgi:hypothetical protein